MMCANYFRAKMCKKEATSPTGRSDTEVVSLLPGPKSPHSPLLMGLQYTFLMYLFAELCSVIDVNSFDLLCYVRVS